MATCASQLGVGPARASHQPGSASDEQLAIWIGEGDERAFDVLYSKYEGPLYRYCLSVLGEPEDARDAVQTVMMNAYRTFAMGPKQLAVAPWLFRVAHNTSISILRRRRGQVELEDRHASDEGDLDVAHTRDRLARTLGDLATLTPQGRGALAMRAFQGLAYEEIGDRLSITPGAARQAVFEARMALEESERAREMSCNAVHEHFASGDRRRLRGRMVRVHLAACSRCSELTGSLRPGRRLAALPSIVIPWRAWAELVGRVDPTTVSTAKAVAVGVAAMTIGAGTWVTHDLRSPHGSLRTVATEADAGSGTRQPRQPSVPRTVGEPLQPIGRASGLEAGHAPSLEPVPAAGPGARSGPHTGDGEVATTGPNGAPLASAAAAQVPASADPSPATSSSGTGGSRASDAPSPGGSATTGSPAAPQASSQPEEPTGATPAAAPGHSGSSPGHGGTPAGQDGTPPGQSGNAPGREAGAPGNAGSAPGHSGEAPGNSGNAPAQGGRAPGNSGNSQGDAGEPPGHADGSPGNSGHAPGHSDQEPVDTGNAPGQGGGPLQ